MTLALTEGISLVEGIIFLFIALNLLLSGSYLLQRGMKKVVAARAK